ncbi:flagellar protein FlaG [Paraneptunicella aestuarii]|uniref:flagellar protein FlaG n=1 Tax=Paraneptunicella aestuarii TaxID=2831148 RepID=UPI001E2FEF8A|nr:flagellar protein FlaG [Paraneptunicella aestuarii]UAA39490.1 flagellar protein FlaG [Paraneptunicella aestuarii]
MDVEFSQTSQLASAVASQQIANNHRVVQEQKPEDKGTNVSINSVNTLNTNADINGKNDVSTAPQEDIETAVGEVSEFVQAQNRNLNFSFSEESNRSVVKVTDSETGELIRQIPSEEVLRLSEKIRELQTDVGAAVGVLFNKEV